MPSEQIKPHNHAVQVALGIVDEFKRKAEMTEPTRISIRDMIDLIEKQQQQLEMFAKYADAQGITLAWASYNGGIASLANLKNLLRTMAIEEPRDA